MRLFAVYLLPVLSFCIAFENCVLAFGSDQTDKEVDVLEDYITKRVKRATLVFTIIETVKKLNKMKVQLSACEDIVSRLDGTDKTLKTQCVEKYEEARKRAGIKSDSNNKSNMVYYIMKELPDNILEVFNEYDDEEGEENVVENKETKKK